MRREWCMQMLAAVVEGGKPVSRQQGACMSISWFPNCSNRCDLRNVSLSIMTLEMGAEQPVGALCSVQPGGSGGAGGGGLAGRSDIVDKAQSAGAC